MKIHRLILPMPQQGRAVNVYLVEGGDLTLVDAGPKTDEAWTKLNQEFRRLRRRLQDVDKIVVTHAHTDHFGLAQSIKQVTGTKVCAHPLAAAWLRDPDSAMYDFFYVRAARFLRQIGTPDEVIVNSFAWPESIRQTGEAVHVDELLEEGSRVQMGGCDWEVLHTPGHEMSSLCFFNPDSRVMFTGDQLLPNVPSNPVILPPRSSREQRQHVLSLYLRSLERLAEMEISICFPGHGDAILDHRAVIQERRKRHEKRKAIILDILRSGPETPYQIARAMISELAGVGVFLGISDVVGHLDILEEEGKVRQVDVDSVVYYEITRP